jgi:hypothetical protein
MMFAGRTFMDLSPLHTHACTEPGRAQTRAAAVRRTVARSLAVALIATGAAFGSADPGNSQSEPSKAKGGDGPDLAGSWSGGGRVQLPSGAVEQARCRAHYSRMGKNSYALNATCATASGKAAQTATLRRVGENRYHGSFHNAEYDITGTISVVVNGNRQSVRLTSSSASAILSLSR